MSLGNPWFLLALLGTVGWFHVKLFLDFLNLNRLSREVPAPLRDTITTEDQERACEYVITHAKLDVIRDAVGLAALLGFWFAGGFGWLGARMESLHLGPIPSGMLLLGTVAVLQGLLSLPFEVWSTFRIEAAFGLNRTTPATFIADHVKGFIVGAIIGSALAAPVLWLFQYQPGAALWAWIFTTLFGLFMTWLAPRFIMPLFLDFTPMEDGPLKQAILDFARMLQFPVQDLYIVDGSRRSTKANAFFTGIGRNRRIALYDTLLEKHGSEEILAVLAHEIGHARLGHVPRMFVIAILQSAIMFGLLHVALRDPQLYAAFKAGAFSGNIALGLVLFTLAWKPIGLVLDLIHGWFSRRHEFEADAFAAEAVGGGTPLSTALSRLSRDHLSHLTPHPWYVAVHHSHPPVLERLAALAR